MGFILVQFLTIVGWTLLWQARPWLIFPIYGWPLLNVGYWLHSKTVDRWRKRIGPSVSAEVTRQEAHYDSMQLVWALLLLALTVKGMPSAYLFLLHFPFSMFREALITMARRASPAGLSPASVHWAQTIALSPLYLFIGFLIAITADFFVPTLARSGPGMNPEWVAMGLAAFGEVLLVMFTSNLVGQS